MNIQTVAENLRNTIAGKERYLTAVIDGLKDAEGVDYRVLKTTKTFLEVNINELKRILQDVEQCVLEYDDLKSDLQEASGRVRQLERENSDMSWEINPDRMGL